MKVGDLVKFKSSASPSVGIIIETGIYSGNKDTKVFWAADGIWTEYSRILEVISENNNN